MWAYSAESGRHRGIAVHDAMRAPRLVRANLHPGQTQRPYCRKRQVINESGNTDGKRATLGIFTISRRCDPPSGLGGCRVRHMKRHPQTQPGNVIGIIVLRENVHAYLRTCQFQYLNIMYQILGVNAFWPVFRRTACGRLCSRAARLHGGMYRMQRTQKTACWPPRLISIRARESCA
jgi:hypothetical protein